MNSLLFEKPWLLLVLLAAVQFLLIVLWSRIRSRRSARLVWGGFAMIPALLVLSTLVVTPTEQIIEQCRALARLVDDGDIPAIGRHLSEDFEVEGLDRASFLARLEKGLTRYRVDSPRLRSFDVTFPDGTEGVAVFDASCRVRSDDAFFDHLLSRWRVTFRRVDRTWLVTHLETIPRPFSPIGNLRDLIR